MEKRLFPLENSLIDTTHTQYCYAYSSYVEKIAIGL